MNEKFFFWIHKIRHAMSRCNEDIICFVSPFNQSNKLYDLPYQTCAPRNIFISAFIVGRNICPICIQIFHPFQFFYFQLHRPNISSYWRSLLYCAYSDLLSPNILHLKLQWSCSIKGFTHLRHLSNFPIVE